MIFKFHQSEKKSATSSLKTQLTSKQPNSKPHGTTRKKAIAKAPANRFDKQIPCVSVVRVFCNPIFKIPTVKEEIRLYNFQYSACLSAHPNDQTVNFMEPPDNRQLRRHLPNDCQLDFLCNCCIYNASFKVLPHSQKPQVALNLLALPCRALLSTLLQAIVYVVYTIF
jgi:hypothetical protein